MASVILEKTYIYSWILFILQGKASGTLYVDDYDSYNYRKGLFAYRQFSFENKKLKNV